MSSCPVALGKEFDPLVGINMFCFCILMSAGGGPREEGRTLWRLFEEGKRKSNVY